MLYTQPDPSKDQIAFLILHIPHTTYVIIVSLFSTREREEKTNGREKKKHGIGKHRHMPITK